MAKFYEYRQNNSFGSFDIKEEQGICENVIIEALNATHANAIAEDKGIYFDGCENGIDCPCCGDRWCRAEEGKGAEVPSLNGVPIENAKPFFMRENCFVHYLDGTIEKFELNK